MEIFIKCFVIKTKQNKEKNRNKNKKIKGQRPLTTPPTSQPTWPKCSRRRPSPPGAGLSSTSASWQRRGAHAVEAGHVLLAREAPAPLHVAKRTSWTPLSFPSLPWSLPLRLSPFLARPVAHHRRPLREDAANGHLAPNQDVYSGKQVWEAMGNKNNTFFAKCYSVLNLQMNAMLKF